MALGAFIVALFVIALAVLALYILYGVLHRAFQRVGFTPGEAALILLGTMIGSAWNVPLWPWPVGGGWILTVNVGGAVVPVLVCVWLLRRVPSMATAAMIGAVLVSLVTYLVTSATPEGIVVPTYLALLPPFAAAALSLTAFWREEDHAAPLAYVSGTFGAIIGADVLRLPEFLAQAPPEAGALASIGGGAVFDMVFLTGIVAVGLDALVFRQRRREVHHAPLPYDEPEVFTVGTSPERMAAWDLPKTPKAQLLHGEQMRARGETVREAVERTPDRPRARAPRSQPPARPANELPRAAPQYSTASGDERLAKHREWEEQMRRRRES
ncbi:MAG TPA: DUF1614 domain-containing protein [Candidatus Thermoplasmatota archaeon]|nr:DUF1614 domain-containing protein [Candidatus Thermoplasmatota archaeon]